MTFQEYLKENNITKYRLSKLSGVPKTTVFDVCSGKSSLGKCSASTLLKLSKALGISMEEMLAFDDKPSYDEGSGLPLDPSYLEEDLPPYLRQSLDEMKKSWGILDSGGKDLEWDLKWCELNADINCAEQDQDISKRAANYLRERYLRMEKEGDL